MVKGEGSCSLACSVCEIVKEESVAVEESKIDEPEIGRIKDEVREIVVIVEKLVGVVIDASTDDNAEIVASVN